MKIAYTVCSLNRLGQVLVLGKSLLEFNPGYSYHVGLADEIAGRIDPADYPWITFTTLSELNIRDQDKFTHQYDAFELSCALKAFYGKYLMEKFNPEILLYLDTDMCIYHDFGSIEEKLKNTSILLSPHFVSPIPSDGKHPREREVLNSGLYNGGFIGLRNDGNAGAFLAWWESRLYDQGFNNVCEGMMVDQLWLNLVPLYFDNVASLGHPGCNLAYWNMHERELTLEGNKFLVNGQPLIFYHFSGYRTDQPGKVSVHQNRYDMKDMPALNRLVREYDSLLKENRYDEFRTFKCLYDKIRPQKKQPLVKRWLITLFSKAGYKLEKIRKI
jgi:hypothetical protein